MNYFRTAVARCLTGCVIIVSLLSNPAYAVNSEDSQIFIAGFNAYQKKDYQTAVERMKAVLDTYPDTPLRDMAIFWLARANFKAGNDRDAARYMSQFIKEYPDSPLKGTVEDELLNLASRFDRGEQIPLKAEREVAAKVATAPSPAKKVPAAPAAAAKPAAEQAVTGAAAATATAVAASAAAAEKAAAERAAREKAEADRVAAEKAAREKAEAERLVAEKAAQERAAAERLAAEKAAREKVEAERVAAAKAAQEQAERDRLAAEQAARERAEAERLSAEKAAQEKAAAEQLAAETAARQNTEAERLIAEKAAVERTAAEKLAAERAAAERAAAELAATQKLAAERAAQEKAAAERSAAEKVARDAAAAERLAAERAASEKAAAELQAAERATKAQAEADRVAREKAEAERRAAEQAARDREQAQRLAAERAAQEKVTAERRAAEQSAAERAAGARKPDDAAKLALRDKAIAEYKSLIDRFPGTRAAATAAVKLQELGITYPEPGRAVAVAPAPEKNAQVLTLEVGQFAETDLIIPPAGQGLEVGRRHEIPFEVVNKGNGTDSFYLEAGFPAEFGAQFAAAAKKEMPINVTPPLAPGERFKGVLSIVVPREFIDGQKIIYPIKAASRIDQYASQSRDILSSASAPLLRAVVKNDKGLILPGEKVTYRIALLNIGTASAPGVSLQLNYPPQYEPLGFRETGFKQEMKAVLVLDGIRLDSGGSRELEVTFQLKEEALAQQELFLRADLVNTALQTRDSFISAGSFVKAVSGVAVRTNGEKLVVIPGQPIAVPLIVTNTGNAREDFLIKPSLPGNVNFTFYQDLNRDGIRQASEPIINHVGPLAPKEESYVILDLATPASEADGATASVSMAFEPESDKTKAAVTTLRLVYSRPVVDLAMGGKGGRLKPGEVSSFELNFTNRGSNMAKTVELQSFLPADLELVASDPSFVKGKNGDYFWKFEELGAGEKRTIKVTFRVKAGTAVGTSIQVKNILKYQDQLGNRY